MLRTRNARALGRPVAGGRGVAVGLLALGLLLPGAAAAERDSGDDPEKPADEEADASAEDEARDEGRGSTESRDSVLSPASDRDGPSSSGAPAAGVSEEAGASPTDGDPAGPASLEELLPEPDPDGLSPDQVARRAVERAPEVRNAGLELKRAEKNVDRIRSGYVPQLDLEAGYTRESEVDQPEFQAGGGDGGGGGGVTFPQVLDTWSFEARLTLPVSSWFLDLLPAYDRTRAQVDMQTFRRETERQTVALRAREAYWAYVATRAEEAVARSSERLLARNVEDLHELVEAGAQPRSELLQVRSEASSAKVRRLRAERQVEVARWRLRRRLQREADEPVPVTTGLRAEEAPELPSVATLVDRAMRRRPEARALRATREIRQAMVERERRDRYPSFSVSGRVLWANPNPRVFPETRRFDTTWRIDLLVSWTPSELFENEHQIDRARLQMKQVDEDLAELRDRLRVRAAELREDLQLARASIEASRTAVEAARESYRTRSQRLEVGRATITDVLDAEQSLRQAQLDVVQAHVDRRRARVGLSHLLGHAVEAELAFRGAEP